jgi:hypothetical protein
MFLFKQKAFFVKLFSLLSLPADEAHNLCTGLLLFHHKQDVTVNACQALETSVASSVDGLHCDERSIIQF